MEGDLDRFNAQVEDARYDQDVPKWRYDQMRQDARDLRWRIVRREEEERRTWPERYDAHRRVAPGYLREVRSANEKLADRSKRVGVLQRQGEFVERRCQQIVSVFGDPDAAPTGRLRWKPFEAAEPTPANIRAHYRSYLRRQGNAGQFDQRRLDEATALPYENWWVPEEGFGGFDAYGIFTFEGTTKALLECPIVGNAAYVVDGEEGAWKKMTKRGLVESGLAKQIPHRGENWPAKIRQALGLE